MSAANMPARAPQVVWGTNTYVPGWAPQLTEEHLARAVTLDGEPLGFTIGDIMPSRRWAVNEKTGELLAQRDFERLYEQYVMYHVPVGSDQVVSIPANNKYFDLSKAPVPNVRRFVDVALDYQGKEIPIGFDPNRPAPDGAREVKVYDHRGEEVSAARSSSATMAKLELLNNLRQSGALSAEALADQVALLTGSPGGEVPEAPEVPVGFSPAPISDEELTAPCGKVCASKAGLAAHVRHHACDGSEPSGEEAA